MKTLPVAVQVYSVREDAEKDFARHHEKDQRDRLRRRRAGRPVRQKSPARSKPPLRTPAWWPCPPTCTFQELVADMEGTIQKYVEIGVKFIAIPYLMEEDRPGTPKFEGNVKLFEEIGKACKAHGIQTLYHNHDFEFVKMPDGRYALDYIYDTIPADLLQTEVDTCWGEGLRRGSRRLHQEVHRPLPCGPSQGLPQGGQARQHVPAHRHHRQGRGEPRRLRVPSRGPWRSGLPAHSGGLCGSPAPSGWWWSRTSPSAAPPWKPSPSAAST